MGKIINLEQGGSQWLAWRLSGLGSSDASVLMDCNPWKTREQLLKEKLTGKQPKTNDLMERGSRLEPKARAAFELTIGRDFPPVCMEHDKHPQLRASLDGWDGNVPVEIKCPGREIHLSAIHDIVPIYYYWQVAHQLLVSGAPFAYYYSFDGVRGVTLRVERKEEELRILLERELAFLEVLQQSAQVKQSRPSSHNG